MKGPLLRLQPFHLTFELYQPGLVLRVSQVLERIQVTVAGKEAYAGKAVVSSILEIGEVLTCEVKLDPPGIRIPMGATGPETPSERYRRWFESWQEHEHIPTRLKTATLSLQWYLTELKALCEQFEVSLAALPASERADAEAAILKSLGGKVVESLDLMRESFLDAAGEATQASRSAAHALISRHLHPLFLCAPFGYRTFQKPLGYAGDYEMMNLIHRNTFEGGSLYTKLVHFWLVNQPPAVSVRVRVAYLEKKLFDEVLRVSRQKRPARILNLGCGPAREIQNFIASHPIAEHAEVTLLDFDAETLDYVKKHVVGKKTLHGRSPAITLRKLSVAQLIKESSLRAGNAEATYDLIYCGGLFDYLSPRICKQVVGMFYSSLAPGGLLSVANMYDKFRRFSPMLEFLLDWHLIYRSAADMSSFCPSEAKDESKIVSDDGINLFLEIRKAEKGR